MRPIKFKGKRLDNQEWIEGNYVVYAEDDGEDVHCIVSRERGMVDASLEFTPVDPETVGQFTGLFDKNGVEIYEGDIMKFGTYFGNTLCREVWFSDGWFYVTEESEDERLSIIGIVEDVGAIVAGNIHSNPELLKNEYR